MKARPILGKFLRLTVARREVAAPQKETAPGASPEAAPQMHRLGYCFASHVAVSAFHTPPAV
jgi:hypothetical protein